MLFHASLCHSATQMPRYGDNGNLWDPNMYSGPWHRAMNPNDNADPFTMYVHLPLLNPDDEFAPCRENFLCRDAYFLNPIYPQAFRDGVIAFLESQSEPRVNWWEVVTYDFRDEIVRDGLNPSEPPAFTRHGLASMIDCSDKGWYATDTRPVMWKMTGCDDLFFLIPGLLQPSNENRRGRILNLTDPWYGLYFFFFKFTVREKEILEEMNADRRRWAIFKWLMNKSE
jgi:hypothetical protein